MLGSAYLVSEMSRPRTWRTGGSVQWNESLKFRSTDQSLVSLGRDSTSTMARPSALPRMRDVKRLAPWPSTVPKIGIDPTTWSPRPYNDIAPRSTKPSTSQLALILNTNTRLFTQPMRSSMVARRLGMSRSIAEAMDGSANSIVAETREAVVSADGWSGMSGGLSPATAVAADRVANNKTR